VAIDARRLQDVPLGGVGRSLSGVVDLVATEVDVVLVTDGRRPPARSDLPQVPLTPPARAPEVVWLQYSVATWLRGFDGVFHGTFNQLPLGTRTPAVVTIHDLSFEVHPEGFSRGKRRVFQLHARHAARKARRIMVPSRHTQRELEGCYRVDPRRIVVTPWAVEPRFGPDRAARALPLCRRLGVDGRYLVAMGGAPRRGLAVAVEAFHRVRARCPDVALVVVGAEAPPAAEGVHHAGPVDDEEWAALLAGAAAFCYPTRYEGFGVPALEGIASGTPVVCAPVASLPEVLGDAAEWCATPSAGAIADGLLRVLDDPHHAAELRRRGLARASAHPSWEDTAAQVARAYHEAADG
jgi:alpha-1,3-rhamnosyl/mannosyltransferase